MIIAEKHNTFDIVLHEVAHAIVVGLDLPDVGHGENFAATMLNVFQRYAPLVDTRMARADAPRVGVVIGNPAIKPISDAGIAIVEDVICSMGEPGKAMCDAYNSVAVAASEAEIRDGFETSGRDGNVYWSAGLLEETPESSQREFTTVNARGVPKADGDIVDSLEIQCFRGLPRLVVHWRVAAKIDPTVRVRIGYRAFEPSEWSVATSSGGEHESQRGVVRGADAVKLWTEMYWASQTGDQLTVEAHARNRPSDTYTATFDLEGLFDTPVQPNLARCGRDAG